MIINKFFPTIIGADVNTLHSNIQDEVVNRCYDIKKNVESGGENWLSNDTYNTIGKHDVFADNKFSDINDFVVKRVKNYCELLHIKKDFLDYKPIDSWFNIYKKGDYQEYHYHGNSVLSVVYFLKVGKNPAKIYFKNPYIDMMSVKYDSYTSDTFETINYKPQPGLILIFRSHLEHSVKKQINDEDRISIAYNFRSNNART
tara:strand:- start:51 stop:653 length:603 start_codon:yes stop_codon:yes gene_type:complete